MHGNQNPQRVNLQPNCSQTMEFRLNLIRFISIMWLISILSQSSARPSMAKPKCRSNCGNVSIPYPFGIGVECYHNPWYDINCNQSHDPPKPFLSKYNLEVINITMYGDYSDQIIVGTPPQNICANGDPHPAQVNSSLDLRGSPYKFLAAENVFIADGCTGSAVLMDQSQNVLAGCASVCRNSAIKASATECSGVGCCQATLDFYLDFYQIGFNKESVPHHDTCLTVALAYSFLENNSIQMLTKIPVALHWTVEDLQYQMEQGRFSNHELHCDGDSEFIACKCQLPYEGNPYLPQGCQVVEECKRCTGHCEQDGRTGGYSCKKKLTVMQAGMLGLGASIVAVLMLVGCYYLYQAIKRRREIKQRARNFKRNGGLLLQQQISSSKGVIERTKIFTAMELDKATDHFNRNRILGQGGQGTVYKGMLMDGSIVAVKKSKISDETQLEQFINEVVIVSQINHRNVVKLIGCCLETEVPLLVYEFFPNGTLSQHIHDPSEDFPITWEMRLHIAAESAGAIAYLHSSSSVPIYHRDIKTSNILLDDKYRAKVSDFGTSRSITDDQTHLTTSVQGTFGYLDPEYFQSNTYTEKSDVYSFGVVLVELLTSKRPICGATPSEWRSLAAEFLFQMENDQVVHMLDSSILKEGKEEELVAVAKLAERCLNMNGKQRPTMKEVTTTLEAIRSSRHSTEQAFLVDDHVFSEMTEIDFSHLSLGHGNGSSESSMESQNLLPYTI